MPFLLVAKPRPHVTLVTLNRPERMNAMSFDVMLPFRQALEEISRDNDTRVVVVTGAGAGFCSGADLVDSGRIPDIDGLTLRVESRQPEMPGQGVPTWDQVQRRRFEPWPPELPRPVVIDNIGDAAGHVARIVAELTA